MVDIYCISLYMFLNIGKRLIQYGKIIEINDEIINLKQNAIRFHIEIITLKEIQIIERIVEDFKN